MAFIVLVGILNTLSFELMFRVTASAYSGTLVSSKAKKADRNWTQHIEDFHPRVDARPAGRTKKNGGLLRPAVRVSKLAF
jgi:hypothetical protein